MGHRTRALASSVAIWVTAATVSPAVATELKFRGLLDLVAARPGPAYNHNVLSRGDSPFDAYGLRLFADAQVNDRLQAFSQVVLRDATSPYVDGAYLVYTPSPALDLHAVAGKMPWPIGTYAPRTYSNQNPLIGTPLMYQYHTTLVWYDIPPNADALLNTSGSGQFGVNYEGYAMGRGMALIDDSYWDVGGAVVGSLRPMEFAFGAVAGTPGWGSTSQDDNNGKSLLGRVGCAPLPGVRLGVSGAYGPYLIDKLNPALPAGRTVGDYHQKLGMADAEFLFGHVEARAEGARNVWETPTVGDLRVTGGYVELKYSLPIGAFMAGRWDALRFGEIADSTGAKRPWDSNVNRLEAGAGYRLNRDAVAKVVYQTTQLERAPGDTRRMGLVAAQLSVAF
jgi:hypothetical protein